MKRLIISTLIFTFNISNADTSVNTTPTNTYIGECQSSSIHNYTLKY